MLAETIIGLKHQAFPRDDRMMFSTAQTRILHHPSDDSRAIRAILESPETHLASVGLYVTSYFSTCSTWLVLHDTRTDVGFRNITVMFSGTPGMPVAEPASGKCGSFVSR